MREVAGTAVVITDRKLRRRCEARLRALSIQTPCDLDALIAAVIAQRPCPLSLMSMPLLGKPYGLWLTDGTTECIWYEQDTTPTHQRHIILHELCHLLCAHRPSDASAFDGPLPDMDRERLSALMRRSRYTLEEEREAELLASIIIERASGGGQGAGEDSFSAQLLRLLGVGSETRPEE